MILNVKVDMKLLNLKNEVIQMIIQVKSVESGSFDEIFMDAFAIYR